MEGVLLFCVSFPQTKLFLNSWGFSELFCKIRLEWHSPSFTRISLIQSWMYCTYYLALSSSSSSSVSYSLSVSYSYLMTMNLDSARGLLFLNRMIMAVDTGIETSREKMLTRIVEAEITVLPMFN